jgi:tRNA 5-methylaminomethyl-2-thiouridine biosynthesis bifunctional protein
VYPAPSSTPNVICPERGADAGLLDSAAAGSARLSPHPTAESDQPLINPTQTLWTPLAPLTLDWRGDAPIARDSGDIFFSTEDGLAETRYVFIEGNRLSERWQTQTTDQPFVIGEIGVGTGLNLCLTITEWLRQRRPGATLHYVGFERAPFRPEDMRRALGHWPELKPVLNPLLARWSDPLPGCHRRYFPEWGLTLDLWWADAADALQDIASHGRAWIDAWYLDGFAPSREPGPWQQRLYDAMAGLSRIGATFATFTAAGDVRRGLATAGFEVLKRPGFGSKREALCGTIDTLNTTAPAITPWDLHPAPHTPERSLVLGAGLAGAHAAFALARRGVAVTVLDAASVAGGGSSNLQGVTYTRLSHRHNPLTDFSLAAFSFAADHYEMLLSEGALAANEDIGLGGYVQLHEGDETLAHLREVLPLAPQFARVVSATEIAALTGLTPRCGGIHYLRGGWLTPAAVCHALLAHPLITLQTNCGPLSLTSGVDGGWQAVDAQGDVLAETDTAILATAHAALQQPELKWLPLTIIRGQTTHLSTPPALAKLSVTLCDQGYLPPARAGLHCLGASFGPGDAGTDEREVEHAHNIDMVKTALPHLDLGSPDEGWRGHVAHRCNSNDYLPVAGPVPELDEFNRRYERLRHDRKRVIDAHSPIQPGLAVLTSLGSRGLSAAPLAAEMVADQLMGTLPTVPRYLQRALSPARFAERALKRGEPL